jgi:hypothetical protein
LIEGYRTITEHVTHIGHIVDIPLA